MSLPANILSTPARMTAVDAEKLRARLNHDLLKNRLILGLFKLQSQIEKKVELVASVADTVQSLLNIWTMAKEDAVRFAEFLECGAWLDTTLELPFVRFLAEDEKKAIAEILLGFESMSHQGQEPAKSVRIQILTADKEMTALVDLVTSGKHINSDAVMLVRAKMEALSACLAIHRLGI